MSRWPDFFIGGMEYAGTTSLYEYVKSVKGIFMSPIKEPWFFAPSRLNNLKSLEKKIDNEKDYLALFADGKEEDIFGEASAVYWRDPDAPVLIHAKNSKAKFILSIRNPIHRLVSSYNHNRADGFNEKSFREWIHFPDYLTNTERQKQKFMISNCIQKLINVFGRTNVKFLIFEEWTKNPRKTVQEICEFLEVENFSFEDEKFTAFHSSESRVPRGKLAASLLRSKTVANAVGKTMPSKVRRIAKKNVLSKKDEKSELSEEDKQYLIDWFQDDVSELEKILSIKFPWAEFR